ncbi:MAG: helix-turn-helix transcriptional regulator [Oscillospiraceae bacterium]|nr:helix-turn-helix transcriptional regulator [Oscillospiraceae bacterium]MBQ9937988.1 helix-turn-helix transcriptional regulator [Oscillospiraceae bacterium]
MGLMIGDKLKKLRRNRDLTQEEVAAHIGISYQAISKWERGDGYPDITMLPTLANYFGVSVDELIGMDEIASAKKLDDINKKWQENRALGNHKENVELMRSALKIYPNNALLLIQLSTSLERLDGSEKEKKEYLKESILLHEQILRYCDDSEIRGAALANISDAYYRYGDYEKAVEYADKLPNLYKTRETALVQILNDNAEKNKVAKSAIEPLAWLLSYHLTALSETENDSSYKEKIIKILDILFDGNESNFIAGIRQKASK